MISKFVFVSLLTSLFVIFGTTRCSDSNGMQTTSFRKSVICDVSTRVSLGCSSSNPSSSAKGHNTLIQCAVDCSKDDSCIGASVDNSDNHNTCFLHKECPNLTFCKKRETSHVFMSKWCEYGTIWTPSKQKCECFDGWPEEKCHPTVKECRDLFGLGFGTGYHRVTFHWDENSLKAFPAYCFISRSYNLARLYLIYSDGKDFNNGTWEDYVWGFDRGGLNRWTGLEHWYDVIKAGYTRVVISVNYQLHGRQVLFRWTLDGFRMEGAENGYAFDYDSSTPIGGSAQYKVADNCLGPNRNVSFSTWDNDNDGVPDENCASKIGSGWWYPGCTQTINTCNMMGLRSQFWSGSVEEELVAMPGIEPLEISHGFVATQVHTEKP